MTGQFSRGQRSGPHKELVPAPECWFPRALASPCSFSTCSPSSYPKSMISHHISPAPAPHPATYTLSISTQKSKSHFGSDSLPPPSSGYSGAQNKHPGVTLDHPLLMPSGQPHTAPLSPFIIDLALGHSTGSPPGPYNRLLLACQTQSLLHWD